MSLQWIRENPALWDAAKQRVLGAAPAGSLPDYGDEPGEVAPGDWWRVERDGAVVGFGWMDTVWGEAEILLAVAPSAQGSGAGTFILERLEEEAASRGLNRIYNTVRPTHPQRQQVMAWLSRRGFAGGDHEVLYRVVRR
jgi:GNAT superfamily N-acetyltransferase